MTEGELTLLVGNCYKALLGVEGQISAYDLAAASCPAAEL